MINITKNALDKLAPHCANKPELVVRLYVKSGGCSGMGYGMGIAKAQPTDRIENIDNLTVAIDNDSYVYLDNITIDYADDGVMGSFTFTNPNAVSSCGCGTSFRPKDAEGCG